MTNPPYDHSAPLERATQGHLTFTRGIPPRVTLRGDPALEELFHAHFESNPPEVQARDGAVTVTYHVVPILTELLHPPKPAEIRLNTNVPWHIEINGGSGRLQADLREVALQRFEIRRGIGGLDMMLAPPRGEVLIRLAGGASDVTIRRPEGTAMRVHIGGGASHLSFDEQHFGAVGRNTHWETPDYQSASDRYDLHISGGASNLGVGTL